MMKEVSMSRSRIFASLTGVFSAALLAARLAVWLFPMTSPAQTVVDDPGISVDTGGALLHRSPVHYPIGSRVAGAVSIEATLNSKGEVADARVISGPDELRKAALASVLDWHYSTSSGALTRAQITIRFDPPPAPAAPNTPRTVGVISPAPADSTTSRIKSIEFSGVSPEAEQELRNRLQIHEGDTVSTADMLRISQAVQAYDSHLRASFTMRATQDNNHEAVLRIALLPQVSGSGPLPAPGGRSGGPTGILTVPPPPPPAPNGQAPLDVTGGSVIRVGGNVQSAKIVSKATPVYPPAAKQARIQGTVQLTVRIGPDGAVHEITPISGDPLLVQAAIDAVKQWVYQPTLLNGNPVAVLTEVDVNFTLSQ
jgi:TonB family protein